MGHGYQPSLAAMLQLEADRIYNLILHSDLPWIDIEIQIDEMRELCRMRQPEKVELFEAVYVSRFHRLWDQWREEEHERGEYDWMNEEGDDGGLLV